MQPHAHTDTYVRDPDATETYSLIASDKVEGTPVYRPSGDKIGTIERVMIDKRSGQVAYAVMSFGGFLGLGHEHYPLPWASLHYSEDLGGYEIDISDEQLRGAPKYAKDDMWYNRETERKVHDYYGVTPYWF